MRCVIRLIISELPSSFVGELRVWLRMAGYPRRPHPSTGVGSVDR